MKIDINHLHLLLQKINCDPIVITFVDKTYSDIFDVFCRFWQKHSIDNLFVICLDEEAIKIAKKYSHNYFCIPYDIKSRWEFWNFRLNILNSIFKLAKKTIIHTDSDCFWINNIIPHLSNCKNIDAHYSIGKNYPTHIVKKWGFVLCCGFFCVKYNINTHNFFDSILLEEAKDDQVATNNWVFRNAINIDDRTSEFDLLHSKHIRLSNINIGGILPSLITRWKECPSETLKSYFCYHPFLTGTPEEKLEQLNHIRILL